jgi:glutamine cyclotransferase
MPSETPSTQSPSNKPSLFPTTPVPTTSTPTDSPTDSPFASPTDNSTSSPTTNPTPKPSKAPTTNAPTPLPVTVFGEFELLETVRHDSGAFTQGLELVPDNPNLYFESTGLYGSSSIRIVDLATGEVQERHNLSDSYFGEGMTYFDGKLVQITWKEATGFVYDASNLNVLEVFSYETTNGEGWGICYVQEQDIFYVTDGTSYLHTWNRNFELIDKVDVTTRTAQFGAQSLLNLNELEWDPFTNTVLANVWKQNDIVRIDPQTGFVTHRYNLGSLYRPSGADVLNGIARTDTQNEFWVTGKRWSNMYRIRLID